MRTIVLPKPSPDYSRNSDRCKGEIQPCVCCGKPVTSPKARYLHVIHGGGEVVHPGDEEEYMASNDAGDMGAYPIGPECLKAHPELREFSI